MKKTGLKGVEKIIYVEFNPIGTNNISHVHTNLMKTTWYKLMFGLIKKIFIEFLTSLANGSYHTKCVSLIHQNCMIQPTLINLHPNGYSQEFHYYPFAVKLYRCAGSSNTLIDLPNKVCFPNKTEDSNLSMSIMITGINELKSLAKHIPCECKCKFDERKCNSNQ